MLSRLRAEARAFLDVARGVDRQLAVVLTASVVLVLLQVQIADQDFYWTHISDRVPAAHQEIGAWAWWFSLQGILGFIIPVALLMAVFKRKPAEIGLGLGDWKLAGLIALAYLPVVVVGTWVLSDGEGFRAQYPHFHGAALDWRLFVVYEALFLLYWMGWEYLWRGFVLFGTAPTLGPATAILVQMVPFALLHASKPAAEAYLSILGGIGLGALVWRCRSFWIAVPIHAAQMIALDLWSVLRVRSGATGIGLDALARALGHGWG